VGFIVKILQGKSNHIAERILWWGYSRFFFFLSCFFQSCIIHIWIKTKMQLMYVWMDKHG